MKINITEEVSKLTTIDQLHLNRLIEKSLWCISDAIELALASSDTLVEVDIGLGSIIITIFDGAVKYKFIPSKTTDEQVINTIVNGRNLLTFELEKNLVAKITNIYKDML